MVMKKPDPPAAADDWSPAALPDTALPAEQDIQTALAEIAGVPGLLLESADFEALYRLAYRHALERLSRSLPVRDLLRREVECEDKFRSVVDNIGIGVAVISPSMRILSLNRQMRQWFPDIDASRQPICYRSFNNPPRMEICSYCPTCKTLEDGQVHESLTETPVGLATRNYRIISSPIRDETGRITAAIEMVEDFTEHRQAAEALGRYREHLEEMVAERTMELSRMNQELQREILERRRMEEALARSSEQIKLFAYSISHDLRSPAVAIEGLCRLLDKRYRHLLDEQGRSCCRQVAKTAHQLVELTEKTNAYIAASHTALVMEEVDLHRLLQELRDEFSEQLQARGIDWREPAPLPTVIADRLAIQRILRNLIDNALKYGGEPLSALTFTWSADHDGHTLVVTDNGVGLSSTDDKIFDLFHRQAGTVKAEGSGLGLAIVKELAARHGGGVKAVNRPEGGVSFHVSLAAG